MLRQKARDSEPSARPDRERAGPKPASRKMGENPARWKALLAQASARAHHGSVG